MIIFVQKEVTVNLRHLLAVFLLFLTTLAVPVFGADYYVSTGGSDTSGDGSPGNPWKTITYTLSQVTGSPGDPAVINIAAGTYNTGLGETFPINLEDYVSLKGSNSDTTVIDASGADTSVIYADSVSNITIEGFNGKTSLNYVQ